MALGACASAWSQCLTALCTVPCPLVPWLTLALAQAQMILDVPDGASEASLHVACLKGFAEVVRVCLDNECDYTAANSTGNTPLIIALNGGFTDIIEMLLDAGAALPDGMLHRSVYADDADTVQCLLEGRADANESRTFMWTPLHICSQPRVHHSSDGGLAVASLLLEHGAKLDAQDIAGETPLAIAVKSSRPKVVDLLLEAGANPVCPDRAGHTPLAKALGANCARPVLETMLESCTPEGLANDPVAVVNAIRNGDEGLVQMMIAGHAGDALYCGCPALWWSAMRSQGAVMKMLLANNRNEATWVNERNCNRNILHSMAIGWVPSERATTLRDILGEVLAGGLLDPLAVDTGGKTALELAAASGNTHMARALMELGPERGFTKSSRESAFVLACENGFKVVADEVAIGTDWTNTTEPTRFVDSEFPPSLKSLHSPDSSLSATMPPFYLRVQWLRASELCGPKRCMFPPNSLDANIRTNAGIGGSCWFWARLTAAGNSVRPLFKEQVENETGVYAFVFKGADGEIEVVIDDFIPCVDGIPVFGYAAGLQMEEGDDTETFEMWSLLLCKAMAKKAGSFQDLFTTNDTSSWCERAGDQFKSHFSTEPTLPMQLGPLFSLADTLQRLPLPLRTSPDDVEYVESLATSLMPQVEKGEILKPQPEMFSDSVPDFILRCDEDVNVAVVITGNIPPDLSVSLENKDGKEIHKFTGIDFEPNSGCFVQMRSAQSPHRATIDTLANADAMDDFALDFKSSRTIHVEYCGDDGDCY